jgi:aconitase A
MTTEWGALAGVFPVDEVTLAWLDQRIAAVNAYQSQQGSFRNHETVPSVQSGIGLFFI